MFAQVCFIGIFLFHPISFNKSILVTRNSSSQSGP